MRINSAVSQEQESKIDIHSAQAEDIAQNKSCCSQSTCHSGEAKTTDNELLSESLSINIISWKVAGMDCPACARKIENIVNQLENVESGKVLFATEKLQITLTANAKADEVASKIEASCLQQGFTLQNLSQPRNNNEASPDVNTNKWAQTVKENGQIITIAVSMLIAALSQYWSPALSQNLFTITCLLGLFPIVKKAYRQTQTGSPFAIETLMSVAALGALYLGETAEAAMVLLLFLIGERLESFAASKARSGVQALMALVPETAIKIIDGQSVEVSVHELQPDDIIEVAPGSRMPADGILLEQAASFDESALTGESIPVEHPQGASVMAGAIVVDKVVRFKITSKQGENAIDRILHLIEEAESRKAPIERFLDRFSRWYTPLMMLIAALVIVIPPLLFGASWDTWIYRGLALLLIACPCALVISTPAAITSGLSAAARYGALIKGGATLEQLGKIETIAFDKTGTLTKGKPEVTDVIAFEGWTEQALLAYSGAIEQGSTHPLAKAIVMKSQQSTQPQHDSSAIKATNKKALVGVGVSGFIEDHNYQISAPNAVETALSAEQSQQIFNLEDQGKTVVVVSKEDQPIGIIALQDTLRESSAQAIQELKAMGVHSIMLTGDNPRSAAAISKSIGIDFKASLLPKDKVTYIEQLSQQSFVAMVGDGINDAPAMKAANVSIAMGGGTDVALETADSALTHNRLTELPNMIQLSRATMANIRQNVTLALGLKGIFLVTSLFGITGLWVAVLADSGATALVTLNALRLLKFKPKSEK
ncbi:zinc/cadmium/mercury/lead-transporting ATPase [Vibrio rumoiensis]|uniref:P-type Zn(2+) transporter n=1 Tax=Vibrio rumoiensis 1S-45 TaxID=1188252 RepID=A0A1E5DZF8_9VIBR|nr:zinc/cadmium/mercury/lead-transporting ATPase [Vibrio rumoiensis]OEF23265.1 zinc/cadmium/mercury/lead-transporting ATPase [Vibrio rumoiensis 1S-45]